MRPLLQLQDEHVLATLSAVVLALKEGRTGLPIGGVFGPHGLADVVARYLEGHPDSPRLPLLVF